MVTQPLQGQSQRVINLPSHVVNPRDSKCEPSISSLPLLCQSLCLALIPVPLLPLLFVVLCLPGIFKRKLLLALLKCRVIDSQLLISQLANPQSATDSFELHCPDKQGMVTSTGIWCKMTVLDDKFCGVCSGCHLRSMWILQL